MDEQKNEDIQDQEFERYGVWVKAGPEEVLEADDDYSMADLEIGAESDEGGPDDLDDGLVSLDDLDLEEPTGDADPFETLTDDTAPEQETEGAEADDMFGEDEDDFDLETLNERLDDDFESLDLDDEEHGEFDRSMPGSDEEIEDISLEDIDDYDSSETLPELDVEEEEATEHDFTPEDQGIEIVPDGPNTALSPDEEEFLLEEDTEEPSDLQNPAESAIPSSMDLQEREAFDRIQTELNEIKNELAELKAVLRETTSAHREGRIPTAAESAPGDFRDKEPGGEGDVAEGIGTGFFEDEEDETIALTGDELDNILNTAEFTEEAGEAEEIDDDFLVTPDQAEDDALRIDDEPTDEGDEEIDLNLDEGDEEIDLNLDEGDEELDVDLDEGDEELDVDLDEGDEELDLDLDEGDEELDVDLDEGDQLEEPVADIELEEDQAAPFVLEGDDSAVDELADMNIDEELADIASLTDETETDESLDEIEIDLDAIDEMEPPPADQTEEPVADQAVIEEEPPLDTRPADDDELEIDLDDLDVTSEDLGGEEATDEDTDEGFEDFAAAVEQDLEETAPDLETQPPDETPVADDGGFPTLGDEEPSLELPDDWDQGEPEIEESPETVEETPEVTEDEGEDLEEEAEEAQAPRRTSIADLPDDLKQEIRSVLSYMDQLLEALPDDKIEEFAQSEHFEVYKHLFDELGLET